MGRQTKITISDLAYIAGFLDGDGSIMVQIKNRKDTPRGWRLGFTIAFYQDTRHEEPLFWIQEALGAGYISHRNDNMTELRIEGYKQVEEILKKLAPYIKFKKQQVKIIFEILKIIKGKRLKEIKRNEKLRIINLISRKREESYQSGEKKNSKLKEKFRKFLEM